jgi:hypothetical protein
MKTWRIAPLAATALLLMSVAASSAAPNTDVRYRLYHFEGGTWVRYTQGDPFPAGGNLPGSNLWKYEYTVKNVAYAGTGINTWYAFFNSDNVLCATLVSATAPVNWTVLQQGPIAPNNNWKERFRTTTVSSYITQGNTLGGYTIEFTWTCPTLPGNQNYDAVTSGGSEASITTEDPETPVPSQNVSWGNVKAIFR